MLIHEWACLCFLGSDASISYRRTFVSTKNRSPADMSLLPVHATGSIDTLHGRESLPLSIGSPIVVTGAHLAFKHTPHEFGNRSIFFSGFPACPKGDVFVNRDGHVLQHDLSVTRTHGLTSPPPLSPTPS